jgi:hypothetical protein
VAKILGDPQVKAQADVVVPVTDTPTEFAAFIERS